MASSSSSLSDPKIPFTLDGREVHGTAGETIWQAAARLNTEIPHLCHSPAPGYRPDGNCRACMVEVQGERVLAASCIRKVSPGLVVRTDSARAKSARRGVFELLLADQPPGTTRPNPHAPFWKWVEKLGLDETPYPKTRSSLLPDVSHQAMTVQLDACIHCNLCVRACREVQVNDVIGLAARGEAAKIVFDFDDPMGDSSCVACGECVQACPTGALMPASQIDARQMARDVQPAEAAETPPPETQAPADSPADSPAVYRNHPDRQTDSLCPFCGVGCQVTYHLRDDKIVKAEGKNGPANRQRLCVKGRFGFDYVAHPHRLTRPLIRREGVAKRWDDYVDPGSYHTHFREASWEEALSRACEGFRTILTPKGEVREAGSPDANPWAGGEALAGFGSAKGSNEEAYLFQKLIRTGFRTNNVDHCTRLCHASSVAALVEGIGSGAVTAPFTAVEQADCILVIGARPTENHPVAATFFKQAAKRGAKLFVLDPRGQELARHAYRHLQFKAGHDVALLNAMIHTIIEEGLVNQAYIDRFTVNYAAIQQNSRAFSPEAMGPLCGVAPDVIRDTARQFATSKRSIIFWGMGVSQHVHGTDNARCLITLASITGHIGREGTGLHPLRGQNNVQGASDAGLIPMFYPDYRPVQDPDVRAAYEKKWNTALDPRPGRTVVEILDAAHSGHIRGMYIMGENPAMSDPDTRHVRQGLARLSHLVVQEIFLTETAFFADVILPASAMIEKTGSFTNSNRQVQLARAALAPPGEARQDWRILQEVAQGLGLAWSYPGPGAIFEEMRSMMPSIAGISWARLEREESVTYPVAHEHEQGQTIVFGEGFPTPDGRVRLVPTSIVPPDELPDAAYPFILTTGRLLEHWHTGAMTRRASLLDGLEPEAVAHLHPGEIAKLGTAPGEAIKVQTRRGAVVLKIRADRNIARGMVFIPFCFAESPANMLTNPQLDPFGKIPEFKFCAARLEPVLQPASA